MWQYIALVTHESQWSRYRDALPLDRDALDRLLNDIRKTRNQLMHFRGEISPVQRNALQYCAQWLALHQPTPRPYADGSHGGRGEDHIEDATATAWMPDRSEEIVPTDEAVSPRDSRYAPLADYLRAVPADHDRIQLSFADIEAIIRDTLPPSAHAHRAWWGNDTVSHVQSREWLDAGWRVASVGMDEGRVVFARIREREHAYIAFYSALLTQLRDVAPFSIRAGSPDGASWHIVCGLPESGTHVGGLGFAFTRGDRFRVEFYIDEGDQHRNKAIFDSLYARKSEIEEILGAASWERLHERRASRIALYHAGSITAPAERLETLRHWAVPAMIRLHDIVNDALSRRPTNESEG